MSKVAAKYGVLRVHPNPEFKKFDGVKMFRPHWPYNDEVIVVEVSTECPVLTRRLRCFSVGSCRFSLPVSQCVYACLVI